MTEATAPPLPPCGGEPAPDLIRGREGAAPAGAEPAAGDGFEWAVVEIFGHRRHAGRIREEERFGAKMLRVDVPTIGSDGQPSAWVTHWYGGSAIFSLTTTDEATVLRANRPYLPAGLYLASPDDDDDTRGDD